MVIDDKHRLNANLQQDAELNHVYFQHKSLNVTGFFLCKFSGTKRGR